MFAISFTDLALWNLLSLAILRKSREIHILFYFKDEMAMAETNGYGNGQTFSQTVIKGPKWSITIHHDPTWSKMVKYGPRLS